MRKTRQSLATLFAGGLAGMFATSCLGPQVLEERAEHAPALNPNVELRLKAEKPADVLVVYDDQDRRTDKVARRAFFLFANEERVGNGKRPVFVEPGRAEAHIAIPILKEPPADPKAVPGEIYAVSSSPRAFRLESRGRVIADFELPEYGNWLTAKKFFLYPLAAAADAVGLGAAAGAAAAVGAAQSGTSISVPVK